MNTKKNVTETVDRYMEYLLRYVKRYNVWVYGPPPNAFLDDIPGVHPTNGTSLERNIITKEFNCYLKKQCELENIKFITLFDYLVDGNLATKPEYYWDNHHLSPDKVKPFLILEFERIKNQK